MKNSAKKEIAVIPVKTKTRRGPFATREEANANKPAKNGYKLFEVTSPEGDVTFVWENAGYAAVYEMNVYWTLLYANGSAKAGSKWRLLKILPTGWYMESESGAVRRLFENSNHFKTGW